jgi:tRNA (guanine-N7-)-methyltransferase
MVLTVEQAREIVAARASASRIEVEIGSGNGHFLTQYGRDRSDTLLIGVDLKARRCDRAAQKAERLGLDHVLFVCALAEQLLDALPSGSVDSFHLYFPDPWPKSRHRRRRFVRRDRVDELHGLLRRGGLIHFATDFFDYYVQAKLLLLAHGGFELEGKTPPPEAFVSVFGRKFAEWGRSFYTVVARRAD